MKLVTRLFLASLFLLLSSPAVAETYRNDVLTVDVPKGFVGPVEQPYGANALTVVFHKPHQSQDTATLLQITTYDFGSKMPDLAKDELAKVSDIYLAQFLKGVERRRASFSSTPPTHLKLGGIPASRVTWHGTVEGQRVHGIMYCVVVGNKVFSFHTQDFDNTSPKNIQQAIRAIETVAFNDGG